MNSTLAKASEGHREAMFLASGEQLGQNRQVSDELDALIAALQRPLSVEDEADGWTDQARARWLAYFSGLREGIRVATNSERAAAPSQLGRWLDYEGIGARHGPLTEAVTRARLSLAARGESSQPPRDVPEPSPTARHHAPDPGVPDFEAYRDALRRHGFREAAARYDERPFGSWFIAVEGNPSSRLLWDGKDEWLLIQRRAGDTWFDIWVARDEHDRNPTSAIEQLEQLRDSS